MTHATHRQHLSLMLMLVVEVSLFAILGTNFFSVANAFEVLRLSVEIGLLTLAMTLVIVSGGIDLSVGSLMGLCAVIFGGLWRDAQLPLPLAALATIGVGAACGAINGWLVAKLRLPPLIVTLGTYSLFRGLAEGLTGGVENYTGLPESFLFLGQGYWFGFIPAQLPLLVVLAGLSYWWLNRAALGRALTAIGFSLEGAQYAGIQVDRRLMSVYVISGLFASLASLVYVAHLGQAKADAGTGYELMAITAVVLGGTSIFGGRGTIVGSLLGLLAIAVLQNGLRLSDLPAELAGILSGVLLLATICIDRYRSQSAAGSAANVAALPTHSTSDKMWLPPTSTGQEFEMKYGQLAILCATILLGALIIAGSNRAVVDAIEQSSRFGQADSVGKGSQASAGTIPPTASRQTSPPATERLTVAMMPKSKGNAYFIACRKGAEEAAAELNVNLLWDGPTDPDPAKQNEVIDTWITRGVDVLAVAVENRAGISSVLRKARQRGIKVITWDSDAEVDARDFFVNQATPEGIGTTLMDQAAKSMGGKGEFAIITASLTAANMIEWQKHIELRRAEKYPDIKMAVLRPCDDKQPKAFDEANNILNAYPNVKLIMGICSPSVPGAAEAVKQSGRSNVKVIGLGLPNDSKRFVHDGITDAVILWNTMDLGYLTVHAARQLCDGKLTPQSTSITGGRLGEIQIVDQNILLGQPFVFTKENIDSFDF
ncbi:MAG: substrate-binding domain-containing protein [Pirellulaceae bacterium]|nr:substrate-binding domain-containing protein [Pirellulaceae bacterium]